MAKVDKVLHFREYMILVGNRPTSTYMSYETLKKVKIMITVYKDNPSLTPTVNKIFSNVAKNHIIAAKSYIKSSSIGKKCGNQL